jgi:hypothetical protein
MPRADDRIDRPSGRPDRGDGQAEKHSRRPGGAHQVLDSLTSGGTRAEPPPQALLRNPEHGHDDHTAGGQRDARRAEGW